MGYGQAHWSSNSTEDMMIINICGDGSFQMNLAEMATAVENNLSISCFVQ